LKNKRQEQKQSTEIPIGAKKGPGNLPKKKRNAGKGKMLPSKSVKVCGKKLTVDHEKEKRPFVPGREESSWTAHQKISLKEKRGIKRPSSEERKKSKECPKNKKKQTRTCEGLACRFQLKEKKGTPRYVMGKVLDF